jgi:hypothetical protein
MLLPIVLGAALAVIHYFSEKFRLVERMHKMKFVSFTGGVFITYLVLHLLPSLFVGDLLLNRISLVFVLVGFSFFHLLEKFIYRHKTKNQEELRKELKEIHSIAFFIYHFIIGIVLAGILGRSETAGFLFFIPLLFITGMSSVSLKGIHGRIRQKSAVKIVLSVSTLLGILVSLFFPVTPAISSILLGFVTGALLFIVIVDSIPKERKGEPVFFILGVALYSLLIGATWLV